MKLFILYCFLFVSASAFGKLLLLTKQQDLSLRFLHESLLYRKAAVQGRLAVNVFGADSGITRSFASFATWQGTLYFSQLLHKHQVQGTPYVHGLLKEYEALVMVLLKEPRTFEDVRVVRSALLKLDQLQFDKKKWLFSDDETRYRLMVTIRSMQEISRSWDSEHSPTDADRNFWKASSKHIHTISVENIISHLRIHLSAYDSEEAMETLSVMHESLDMSKEAKKDFLEEIVKYLTLVREVESLYRVYPDVEELNHFYQTVGKEAELLFKAVQMEIAHDKLIGQLLDGYILSGDFKRRYLQLLDDNSEWINRGSTSFEEKLLARFSE